MKAGRKPYNAEEDMAADGRRLLQDSRCFAERLAGRHSEGLSRVGAEVPSRHEPGRQVGHEEVPADPAGLRRAEQPGEAGDVRPLRQFVRDDGGRGGPRRAGGGAARRCASFMPAPAAFTGEDVDFSQFFGERFGGEPHGGGLGDLFAHFRRGGRGPRRRARARRRGADMAAELEIPFATSITGGEVQLGVQRPTGKTETLMVKIPAGIEDGKKIRVRGQGEPAAGQGTPGDILITIHVAPHPCFSRRGNHLHVRVPLTLGEAASGAKVDLPTPTGTVALTIPPGTSSGTKFRVKGHGVASRGPRRRPAGRGANRPAQEPRRGRSPNAQATRPALSAEPSPDLRW